MTSQQPKSTDRDQNNKAPLPSKPETPKIAKKPAADTSSTAKPEDANSAEREKSHVTSVKKTREAKTRELAGKNAELAKKAAGNCASQAADKKKGFRKS